MPFTLQSVAVVLRNERGADALEQAGPLISQCIGPSQHLSLSAACSFRSTTLLDWIWACSCPTQHDSPASSGRTGGWTLARFLRCDEFYNRWQFVEATHVVVEHGDMELLQWLFDHFQDTVVPCMVVALAFLVANTNTSRGIKVEWYPTVVQVALQLKQLETAHWLHHYTPLGTMTEQVRDWTIKAAMDVGDMAFCESLLPKGRCILDYADFCATPAMIEWKLDCGYFQRDWAGAVVQFMTWSAPTASTSSAASPTSMARPRSIWTGHGNVDVMKFMVGHPTGQQIINEMGRSRALSGLMYLPAAKGNIEALQFLKDEDADGPFEQAMVNAISNGQLEAVKWLPGRYPRPSKIPEYCFMDEAARRGRVDMLQLFESLEPSNIPGLFTPASPPPLVEVEENNRSARVFVEASDRHRKTTPKLNRYRYLWLATDPMDDAAANGQLNAVEWLHENRTEGCTTAALDAAAANGYLAVVKWLHANRSEGCTSNAMDFAAEGGHLTIVKWFHANTTAGCTTDTMDLAAAGGHLKTLEWLATNRSEGCTAQAIQRAVSNGHLGIASWLMRRFTEFNPASFSPLVSKNKFEVLLFLHVHHPETFTPDFVRSARLPITGRPTPSDVQIQAWLKLHYPVPEIPQDQGGRAQGLAGRIAENIAQQIARQLGGDFQLIPIQQPGAQGPAAANNALAMVMNNIMVRVEHGDGNEDIF
ncbi:hypothetical protein PHYSODRAFT_342352 [Phytophthora sojae]|uniref:Uncharacterized protein n=1 Tax=Phytophthora sojae (strain P6497) TaxID=1094619 RepID=G5AG38_PHYSP|nr:hypothetical protein PHYSODRAFT_342352 [Phytophthora sojae]EGZ05550.1 hypothetical protein PHYSODRAFT_342352 [Phytophthora sojae]|eukprot:XP_009539081.1 hypothetical protein PHYSODRAFT_342352 [Phytophthora sojae]